MLTYEQRRDRFKVRCRPIIQRYWTRFKLEIGSAGASADRDWFREFATAMFLEEIVPELIVAWGAEAGRIAGDAESVIHELIDELPTLESTN